MRGWDLAIWQTPDRWQRRRRAPGRCRGLAAVDCRVCVLCRSSTNMGMLVDACNSDMAALAHLTIADYSN